MSITVGVPSETERQSNSSGDEFCSSAVSSLDLYTGDG